MADYSEKRVDTRLARGGMDTKASQGFVNPPVYRGSTVLFPSMEAVLNRRSKDFKGYSYGLYATPTSDALVEAVHGLEGGYATLATASGLSAITHSIAGFVRAGDHILVADSAYGPTRMFCDQVLARFGVETTYYDPLAGAGIAELIRPESKLVLTESPGSLTFEVQDIPAICRAAHAKGLVVVMDNTWATPLYFDALGQGVDVVLHAGTKYIGGHSDILLGLVTAATEEHFRAVQASVHRFGDGVSPDVCALALRGLRSMAVRLKHQEQAALDLARWLQTRPEVKRVIHPALPGDAGHELWKRDFTGSSGLFGLVLHTADQKSVAAMLDNMELFGMGFSWGGFESLILPVDLSGSRTATTWDEPGQLIRISVGLEDLEDLKDDLEAGFTRLGRSA